MNIRYPIYEGVYRILTLHFLHAEKTCNRVMAYTKSPVNKTVYQEKNGKIIPYVPALKKVSKTKRNNSLKM